ncbi:MAG: BREX-3 system phosphatase PglZ [Anaerolineales bacterium]|nr:BREX-3 system phosphatase PglZ [Anaerolineales bacterium]
MLSHLLDLFPAHTHPLTLVSDVDGLLADENTLAALIARGFTLIQEADPILLRCRAEQARPFTSQNPLIIITADALETLPYDLWQQGHRLSLDLPSYFPNLAYPLLRSLTPLQRARLDESPAPSARLGRQGSIDYLLKQVFGLTHETLQSPAEFIAWLEALHQQGLAPLPEALLAWLLEQLQSTPAYMDWPLGEMLHSRQAFTDFIQNQWEAYIRRKVGELAGDYTPIMPVLIPFQSDAVLQDALPRLVRGGSLVPLQVMQPERLPEWAAPAIRSSKEDPRPKRVDDLQAALYASLTILPPDSRWEAWGPIARAWAELSSAWYSPGFQPIPAQQVMQKRLQAEMDPAFLAWLSRRYAPLGAQRLPTPHHLHHVPYFLAYLRSQGTVEKVVLLILDGLSLADWMLIAPAWRERHASWRFDESLLLAQIPTITSISRLALASGLRPSELAAPGAPGDEAQGWLAFWGREGLPGNAIATVSLSLDRSEPPSEISNHRLQALCLIDRTIDNLMHGSVLGAADLQASVRLWLESGSCQSHNSTRLETLIDGMLERGFTIFVTSDHGHCEARGMGQPSEGLTAQTRGKRARLYNDRRAAQRVQTSFPETILWEEDGLLPDSLTVLMPEGRQAFTSFNETVVTHGGCTLDEVIVPLVKIQKSDEV